MSPLLDHPLKGTTFLRSNLDREWLFGCLWKTIAICQSLIWICLWCVTSSYLSSVYPKAALLHRQQAPHVRFTFIPRITFILHIRFPLKRIVTFCNLISINQSLMLVCRNRIQVPYSCFSSVSHLRCQSHHNNTSRKRSQGNGRRCYRQVRITFFYKYLLIARRGV